MYYGWLSLKRSERSVFLLYIVVMAVLVQHKSSFILLSWKRKEMKRRFMRKTSLAEWHSAGQVAFILIIFKMAVYKNKGRQQTLGTAKLQSDGGRKQLSTNRRLIWLSLRNDSHGRQTGVHGDWCCLLMRTSPSLTFDYLVVRRRPGEGNKPQCHAPTVKFGGASWWSGDAPSTLGSGWWLNHVQSYLEENLLSSEDWFLQWDNAPRHTA